MFHNPNEYFDKCHGLTTITNGCYQARLCMIQLICIIHLWLSIKPAAVGPRWTLDQTSGLFATFRTYSFFKSQSGSNCLVCEQVAALICLATSWDVTGVHELLLVMSMSLVVNSHTMSLVPNFSSVSLLH